MWRNVSSQATVNSKRHHSCYHVQILTWALEKLLGLPDFYWKIAKPELEEFFKPELKEFPIKFGEFSKPELGNSETFLVDCPRVTNGGNFQTGTREFPNPNLFDY